MRYGRSLLLATLLCLPHKGMAENKPAAAAPLVQTTEIHTDIPARDPELRPFFAESPDGELMELIEDLKERVQKLEAKSALTSTGEILLKSTEGASITTDGKDVKIAAPGGTITFDAAHVKLPQQPTQ
jgi:hypothetical protein